jgi:succinate-semialdehyde dehydrogenase/glutarate-semialdehyde dehydrogenase
MSHVHPNRYHVVDPCTGAVGDEFARHSLDEAVKRLEALQAAQKRWARSPFERRASALHQLAQRLRDEAGALAQLMADEMGKPLSQGRGEVEKSAWACEYYARHGADALQRVPVALGPGDASTGSGTEATGGPDAGYLHEPLGVVLAVMPWNFPVWQVVRAAAPALLAGNAVVLKHAPNVPGCAEALAHLFATAGFSAPDGESGLEPGPEPGAPLLLNLRLALDDVAEIIAHSAIQGVTLTGSVAAGRAVAALAGRHLKKTVLELGGSDAYIVLDDADLDRAAEACVTSRLQNAGQSCIAAKRLIVVDEVHDAFVARVLGRLQSAVMGPPLDPATTLGPLAREDLRDTLHDQVRRSVEAGARLRLGGEVPDEPGWWYPPTLLTDVTPGMPAADEELFGPVAAVLRARDEAHAIKLANDTPFGLGAAVFTRNLERGRRIAERELQAGSVFVNDFVRSDPRLPFGGIRASGYGRELSPLGIREFVNVKTVVVR